MLNRALYNTCLMQRTCSEVISSFSCKIPHEASIEYHSFKCLDCSEKKLDFWTGIYVAFVQVQIAVFMKRCVSFVN